MSQINKAVARLAKRDIGFRRLLLAAMGQPMRVTPSPLRAKMAAGVKVANVAQQTMDAFADANLPPMKDPYGDPYADPAMAEAMEKRDLKFRARQWLPLKQWTAVMANAIPRGYNEFNAKRVGRWLAGIERKFGGPLKLQPARESSVATYVQGPRETLEAIIKSGKRRGGGVDEDFWERGKEGEVVRLWWD